MRDLAYIAIAMCVLLVPLTWIAAALLVWRDRQFPRTVRPELRGPWAPPKWARERPWLFRVLRMLLMPLILVSLAVFTIVFLPIWIWRCIRSRVFPAG